MHGVTPSTLRLHPCSDSWLRRRQHAIASLQTTTSAALAVDVKEGGSYHSRPSDSTLVAVPQKDAVRLLACEQTNVQGDAGRSCDYRSSDLREPGCACNPGTLHGGFTGESASAVTQSHLQGPLSRSETFASVAESGENIGSQEPVSREQPRLESEPKIATVRDVHGPSETLPHVVTVQSNQLLRGCEDAYQSQSPLGWDETETDGTEQKPVRIRWSGRQAGRQAGG